MIETVLGPIPGHSLGVTSMHDHVLADSSRLQRAGTLPAPADERVTMQNLGYLRWNQLAFADNLRLDDVQIAIDEFGGAVAVGQQAVVDSTCWGLGPDHAGLPAIARASGMTIVSSYGAYIPRTLPPHIAAMSEKELEADLLAALTDHVPGTNFKAGIIGIMGTSGTVADDEKAQLRAAARAALHAGAAVTVRLDQHERPGIDVLDLLAAEGLDASRVVFTNADEFMDAEYWTALSAAGAVLEMCFGTEAGQRGRVENPSDHERIDFFVDFVGGHPLSRHTLGGSNWTKTQQRHYGGYGNEHLLARIVPELADRGVSRERLDQMLVGEPRLLLDRDAVLAAG
ncbi:phosphotriesterase family protein [Subtercola endophyticus]|uniref:phosphotriesterase family protein n=1 Tax=Subtercola endophyticus TaxID=2895559 RepID=UPI001E5AF5F3|nr:hypothetical protein [Subtercola endophyticus]UFS58655.1 hypothetical protein LQ955_16915 [Subtercola endophyticus]